MGAPAMAAAEFVLALVGGDAKEPAAEIAPVEALDGAVSGEKRFLAASSAAARSPINRRHKL